MSGIEIAIAMAGIPAECLLLAVWLYRGRQPPLWSVGLYAAYHLLFSISMRLLHLRVGDLGVLAYVDDAVDFALVTSVVVECFLYMGGPGTALPAQAKRFAVGALAAGISVAGMLVASLKIKGFTQTKAWNHRVDLLSSLLLCTFLLISESATVRLGAPRTAKINAITRALAIWAGVALMVDIGNMVADWSKPALFDEVASASWVVMITYWAYAIWTAGSPKAVDSVSQSSISAA